MLRRSIDWLAHNSFRLQLIGAAVLSEILLIAALTYLGIQQMDKALTAQIRARIEQGTHLFNAALASELVERNYSSLRQTLEHARGDGGIEYAVLHDERGNLVAATGWEMNLPLPAVDADVRKAADSGIVHLQQAILLGDRSVGMLRYGLPTAFFHEARRSLLRQVILVASAGILISTIGLFLLGFGMMRRLGNLASVARRLAEGDTTVRVSSNSNDEIGRLGAAFNYMAETLDARLCELRAGEEQLALVMRGTSDGIWDWDVAQGRYYLSPRYRELLGYSDTELPNERASLLGIVHPEDRPRIEAAIRRHFKERTPYDIEYRMRHRDGGYRWFRGRGLAVWNDAGRVIRFAGASSDITAQKQAEQEIHSLLNEKQALLDNALVGIVYLRNRIIISSNRRFERLFGYEPGEMTGQTTEMLYPHESREVYETRGAETYQTLGSSGSVTEELQLRRKDGSLFWGYLTGRAIDPDKPNDGSVWIYLDVTERRLAMAALQDEKNLSDALLAGLPGIFALFDQDMNLLRWNRNLEAVCGYTADELRGIKADQLYYTDEDVRKASHIALQRGIVTHGEATLKTADGRAIPYYLYGAPIQRGERKLVVGLGFDISERKNAEAEIANLNAELEQRVRERTAELTAANKELESFSYSVSHDLISPLRAIDGYARMIEEDYDGLLDPQGKGYIGRIRSGTQRMHQLIDDMLALSRVTRNEMRRVHVDLSGMAERILSDLKQMHPEREVVSRIALDIRDHGDPNLLRIALENLLRNAWKFTAKKPAKIEFGILHEDDKPVYFVRDNGAGFEMKYAGKLFGAFQRMHGPHEFEGTGIGLAIVQRIIQRHGGRIWAEAAPEQGATFYFTLS